MLMISEVIERNINEIILLVKTVTDLFLISIFLGTFDSLILNLIKFFPLIKRELFVFMIDLN